MNEKLLRIKSDSRLSLLKAAYHLGNRHVEIEIIENELFILNDEVIEKMLKGLDLKIERVNRIFSPDEGAYN